MKMNDNSGTANFRTEYITSRANLFVTDMVKLKDLKSRAAEGAFLAEGVKLVTEAAKSCRITDVLLDEAHYKSREAAYDAAITACSSGARLVVVTKSVLDKVSTELSPQGVIARVLIPTDDKSQIKVGNEDDFIADMHDERILLLDALRDPGNLGTVMRTACAFGIDRIIMADCADVYNPKVVRASMGALFRLKLSRCENLASVITALRSDGRRCIAAALSGESMTLGKYKTKVRDCVVIGNEGHGISDKVMNACGETLKIPMAEGVESLNAGVAASVILWEYFMRMTSDE